MKVNAAHVSRRFDGGGYRLLRGGAYTFRVRNAGLTPGLFACAVGLAACTAPAALDGGGGDAGTDAPLDAVTLDSGTDAASADAPDAVVAGCWAAIDAVFAQCAATTHPNQRRLCTLRAYRGACSSGRPEVVTAIASCLAAAEPCSTARDPGTGASCVAGIVTAQSDAAQTTLDQQWCTCSPTEAGCPDAPAVTGPELSMIDDTDAASMTGCLTRSCTMPTFCFGSVSLGAALLQCDMVAP